jgi:hypothetical protein
MNYRESMRFLVITKTQVLKFEGSKKKRAFYIKDIVGLSVLNGGDKPEMCIHHKEEADWKFVMKKPKGREEVVEWL